jgi:hypothetical protein
MEKYFVVFKANVLEHPVPLVSESGSLIVYDSPDEASVAAKRITGADELSLSWEIYKWSL